MQAEDGQFVLLGEPPQVRGLPGVPAAVNDDLNAVEAGFLAQLEGAVEAVCVQRTGREDDQRAVPLHLEAFAQVELSGHRVIGQVLGLARG